MGGRGRDWVIGCGFLRSWVVFLPLFTLFWGMVLGGVYMGCCGQGFRPIPWSVAVVACVRFRLCRFSVLMVFRLVAASVLGCATQGRVVNNDGSGGVCLVHSYRGMGTRGGGVGG